jgi:hypothetical protein
MQTSPVALAVGLALLTSCGGLSSRQRAAAEDAIASLEKVRAGSQVGISYTQNGPLIVDGKAKVNAASELLPDGGLRSELNNAMEAYSDGLQLWAISVRDGTGQFISTREPLSIKYSVPAASGTHGPRARRAAHRAFHHLGEGR